jgi:uncharacterized membrane protein YhaH (DUF805 family)
MFKVVFSGELMPGFTLDNVKSYLATLFKSDLSKIDSLFTGRQVVLKRELKEADADKYVAVLRNAGALAHKESDLAASLSLVATEEHDDAPAAATTTDTGQMTCPKCGHVQVKAVECAACGIIIDKYIARQAQQPDIATTPEISRPSAAAATSSTPYAPPQSAVGEALPEYGELQPFTTNGRIGRLRYLAWSLSLILLMTGGFILAAIGYAITPAIGFVLGGVGLIAAMVVGVQIGVQRLHDIGWSGWLYLLALVPYLGSVFSLVIMLIPGSAGANRFGAPPPENTRAVKILAGLWILVPVIGILAAIALPAYQDYLLKASQ